MTMADRIAVLHEGRLQQIGAPREVYERPASAFVARFIGAANIFAVEGLAAEGSRLRVATRAGVALIAPAGAAPAADSLSAVIRPEKIRLAAPGLDNAFRGRVAAVAYVGATLRCQVVIADGVQLAVALPADAAPARLAAGDAIDVGWDAAATILVPER